MPGLNTYRLCASSSLSPFLPPACHQLPQHVSRSTFLTTRKYWFFPHCTCSFLPAVFSLRFEQILQLPGHRSAIWGLDVSYDGSFCLTGGEA